MHNLTDVDDNNAFTTPVQAPDDGDPAQVSTVNLAFQKLADRTRYLYNILQAGLRVGAALNQMLLTAGAYMADAVLKVDGSAATDAAGVWGIGAPDTAGLIGQGGSGNSNGVEGYGFGSGWGGYFEQGVYAFARPTTNGHGLESHGDGTGAGGVFYGAGNGAGASDDAVEAKQNLKLSGTNPSSSTAFTNRITKKNFTKAFVSVTCNASPTIDDGFNVGAVSYQAHAPGNWLRFTFGTAMANAHYHVDVSFSGAAYYAVHRTTTYVDVAFYDPSTGNYLDIASTTLEATVRIEGAQ